MTKRGHGNWRLRRPLLRLSIVFLLGVPAVQAGDVDLTFTAGYCSVDGDFPTDFACGSWNFGDDATIDLTWHNPDAGTSTVVFRMRTSEESPDG